MGTEHLKKGMHAGGAGKGDTDRLTSAERKAYDESPLWAHIEAKKAGTMAKPKDIDIPLAMCAAGVTRGKRCKECICSPEDPLFRELKDGGVQYVGDKPATIPGTYELTVQPNGHGKSELKIREVDDGE